MIEEIKKYTITIAGESYTIVSDETEDHVLQAAQMVNELMTLISTKAQYSDTKKIAILTALKLASDVISSENVLKQERTEIEKLNNYLTDELTSL